MIDTHVHFDDDRFDQDRDEVYSRALAAGVSGFIVPATTKDRWQKIFTLCKKFNGLYPTAGLHPVYVNQHSDEDLQLLDAALSQHNCIAVGECGLDGFIKDTNYKRQRFFFEQQLEIAAHHNLPTIVHARNAVEDIILSIKSHPTTSGVIHSYNGSLEQAKRLIDLGYLLSFGGAITYERATRLRKLITQLPIEAIMVETDAPDQPGSLHSGERNEPAYLTETVAAIAELKNITAHEVATQSNANACRLFNIST